MQTLECNPQEPHLGRAFLREVPPHSSMLCWHSIDPLSSHQQDMDHLWFSVLGFLYKAGCSLWGSRQEGSAGELHTWGLTFNWFIWLQEKSNCADTSLLNVVYGIAVTQLSLFYVWDLYTFCMFYKKYSFDLFGGTSMCVPGIVLSTRDTKMSVTSFSPAIRLQFSRWERQLKKRYNGVQKWCSTEIIRIPR